ncbi:TetR family transcriptional regulator [Thalassospira alkalitolerans]|uniref:TetR family transcriptional regulator n=1 Tax=Thalassospira alkalitolerans TaxID=1293890 RepID=UPI003AA98D31
MKSAGKCARRQALVDVGYASISTPLIASKALVTRGAFTHQFPTRKHMVVALFEKRVDEWRGI